MLIANRLSSNTLTLLLSNGGSTVLSFLLSVLIGRVLGQEGLGVYAAALAWVFPLALIAEFGIGTLITRDVAQRPEQAADYLRATTSIRLLLGVGLTLALLLTAPLLSRDAQVMRGLQVSAPLVLIAPFFGAYTAVFRARQVMWPVALLNLGMLVTQVILTALVFLLDSGVLAALLVNTATSAGQLAAARFIWRGWFALDSPSANGLNLEWKVLLRQAWPFALAGILAAVQSRLSVILLEQWATTPQVGYYAAASRFVEAGRMLPNAFFGALFPALSALRSDSARLNALFRRVLLGLAGFSLLLALGFSLFAAWIIPLTYGAAFAPAVNVLQIAAWGLLPGLLRGGLTLYWYAQGHEATVNRVTGLALLAQVGLSAVLIPMYGAVGVAMVLLLVEIIMVLLLSLPLVRR